MNMRDGSTGKLIWESSAWGPDMFEKEMTGMLLTCTFYSIIQSFKKL